MFIDVKPLHNECQTKSKLLNDMANHTYNWRQMWVSNSMTTSCHECSHAVSADLRNDKLVAGEAFGETLWQPDTNHKKPFTGPNENGFYLFDNKAFKCKEPKVRKSHAAEYVPNTLRGFRFNTYITGQTAWDDTPLYIFDEWSAYIAGSSCAIELAEMGDMSPRGTDISSGPVEFLMYSMGLVLAVEKRDKDYFTREPNFLPFCSYQAARALKTAEKCNEYFPWDATKKYLDLWNSDTCKAYREILGETPTPTPKPLNPEDFAQA